MQRAENSLDRLRIAEPSANPNSRQRSPATNGFSGREGGSAAATHDRTAERQQRYVTSADEHAVVFQGAQGVLLDERFGFHPHPTYSRTFEGAQAELRRWAFEGEVSASAYYALTRFDTGRGPLPTETSAVAAHTQEPHNLTVAWQQDVRKGWLDLVLLEYAMRACGGVDCLALTQVDALRRLPDYRYYDAYDGMDALPLPASLREQEALTAQLTTAQPRYRALARSASVDALCEVVAHSAKSAVRFTSHGPRAHDVALRRTNTRARP